MSGPVTRVVERKPMFYQRWAWLLLGSRRGCGGVHCVALWKSVAIHYQDKRASCGQP